MTLPKKKYRDKVRNRLQTIQDFFSDKDRTKKMIQRVGGFAGEKGELNDKLEIFYIFLEKDVPALLDALDEIASNKQEIGLKQDRDYI